MGNVRKVLLLCVAVLVGLIAMIFIGSKLGEKEAKSVLINTEAEEVTTEEDYGADETETSFNNEEIDKVMDDYNALSVSDEADKKEEETATYDASREFKNVCSIKDCSELVSLDMSFDNYMSETMSKAIDGLSQATHQDASTFTFLNFQSKQDDAGTWYYVYTVASPMYTIDFVIDEVELNVYYRLVAVEDSTEMVGSDEEELPTDYN